VPGIPLHPFLHLRRAELFGSTDETHVFVPSIEEYAAGAVHRPDITPAILARLESPGWALVRGLGAAGKTVLAVQLALDWQASGGSAYYLDLTRLGDGAGDQAYRALEVLSHYASPRALFILDNVHLDEPFAAEMLEHWLQAGRVGRLLMMGRFVAETGARGLASPLKELEPEALTLQVKAADLAAVYHRLARRWLGPDAAIRPPPDEVLASWLKLFGGDLIVFSAAVAYRIDMLTRGDWRLLAGDAVDKVREEYLAPEKVSPGELRSLLWLAVMARLELTVQAAALHPDGARRSLKVGLVHRQVDPRTRRAHLYLIHPGLGELLLVAAGREDDSALRLELAVRHRPTGLAMATRLAALGRREEAAQLLRAVIDAGGELSEGLTVQEAHRAFDLIVDLEVMPAAELDRRLSSPASMRHLCEAAVRWAFMGLPAFLGSAERRLPSVFAGLAAHLGTPESIRLICGVDMAASLGQIAPFLGYMERAVPALFEGMSRHLLEPSVVRTLCRAMCGCPLSWLLPFLIYAERKLPGLFRQAAAFLAGPDVIPLLGASVLRAPVSDIPPFLRFAMRRMPEVYAGLRSYLLTEPAIEVLCASIHRAPLEGLASFLAFVGQHLPSLFRRLKGELSTEPSILFACEAADRTRLENLASYLTFAARELPAVHARLAAHLMTGASIQRLCDAAMTTLPSHLVAFAELAERQMPAVFPHLDAWLASQAALEVALRGSLQELATLLQYVHGRHPARYEQAVKTLTGEGLPALARRACVEPLQQVRTLFRHEAVAKPMVAAIDLQAWEVVRLSEEAMQLDFIGGLARELSGLGRPELAEAPARAFIHARDPQRFVHALGINQLSHILRLGRASELQAILRLVDAVASPAWLRAQYQKVPAGAIAAALMGVWEFQPPALVERLRHPALEQRVLLEVRDMPRQDTKTLSGTIQLIGCAPLIQRIDLQRVGRFVPPGLRLVEVLEQTDAGSDAPFHLLAQVWLGVRELVALMRGLPVPEAVGEAVLRRFREAAPTTRQQRAVNGWMIAWLEESRQAGWWLAPDRRPLEVPGEEGADVPARLPADAPEWKRILESVRVQIKVADPPATSYRVPPEPPDAPETLRGEPPEPADPPVTLRREPSEPADPAAEPRQAPTPSKAPRPARLFYSYAPGDRPHLEQLEKHLALLRRQGLIEDWHRRQVDADARDERIAHQLEQADLILLLISADFLHSDDCYVGEMTRALERHRQGQARVLPVILRDCDWRQAPFGALQALPRDARPVVRWGSRDEAWTDVALGIRQAIEGLGERPTG
jgi:hypothetical protein